MSTTVEKETPLATAAVQPATLPARRRRRARRTPPARLAVLSLLVSAQFVAMLDTSIVNVALPSIRGDLGVSATGTTWIVNAYVLSFGGLLLLSGRLADIVGRRTMFVVGSSIFLAGTLLAAGAPSEVALVVGRVVQGMGAAALSPAAMSLLLLTYPGSDRARAMSMWGAASALGGASGVLLGGLLAGTVGWRFVFLVTVPVSVAAVAGAWRVLEADAGTGRRRVDLLGSATVTAAVVALAYGALNATDHGWGSWSTMACLGLAIVLGLAFTVVESRAIDPVVPLALFRSRALSAGVALAVLGGAARASTFVIVALFLQDGRGLLPQQAGLAMLPTSVTGFVVSIALLPRLLRRFGARRTLSGGLFLLAGGQLGLAFAPAGAHYAVAVLPGLMLVAVGVAASFTPTTMIIARATPTDRAGLASGLAGSSTQIGAALGTAAFTAIGLATATADVGSDPAAGFAAAFAAAAVVAVVTALVALFLARDDDAPRVRASAAR